VNRKFLGSLAALVAIAVVAIVAWLAGDLAGGARAIHDALPG
jgi:hypothetical protein